MSSQQTESDRIEHLTETVKKQLDLSVQISEELVELKHRVEEQEQKNLHANEATVDEKTRQQLHQLALAMMSDEMSTVKQEIDFVKFDRMILHEMVDRITLLEASIHSKSTESNNSDERGERRKLLRSHLLSLY